MTPHGRSYPLGGVDGEWDEMGARGNGRTGGRGNCSWFAKIIKKCKIQKGLVWLTVPGEHSQLWWR